MTSGAFGKNMFNHALPPIARMKLIISVMMITIHAWVFQLYRDKESLEAFLSGEWYPVYLREVAQFVAAEPQVTAAAPVWIKAA